VVGAFCFASGASRPHGRARTRSNYGVSFPTAAVPGARLAGSCKSRRHVVVVERVRMMQRSIKSTGTNPRTSRTDTRSPCVSPDAMNLGSRRLSPRLALAGSRNLLSRGDESRSSRRRLETLQQDRRRPLVRTSPRADGSILRRGRQGGLIRGLSRMRPVSPRGQSGVRPFWTSSGKIFCVATGTPALPTLVRAAPSRIEFGEVRRCHAS